MVSFKLWLERYLSARVTTLSQGSLPLNFKRCTHVICNKPGSHEVNCRKKITSEEHEVTFSVDTYERTANFIMSHTNFFNNKTNTYSPMYGLSIYNKNMYTEFIDDNAYVFFRLLELFDIKYGGICW